MKKLFRLMRRGQNNDHLRKIWLTMKLTMVLFFLAISQMMASEAYSQVTKVSLHMKNAAVKEVLNSIEQNSEFVFLYNSKLVDVDRKVSIDYDSQKIASILDDLFQETDVAYTVVDRQIVLTNKADQTSFTSFGSQQGGKIVTGTVRDTNGQPIPGVTVLVKGTTVGLVTDIDGKYSIKLPATAEFLVFSFVGMISQETKIGGQTKIDVVLAEASIGLQEVVAVAYGTAKKKDLTGAVTMIDSKLVTAQSNSTVTRALEGAVAGLQVSAVDGQPGLDMGIRIRGLGTASQNNSNALVVIDGVPAQNDNPLSTINPKDIASVSVLKDAASTAMFGSRGANGVVLITTKNGSKGKTKISFEGRWGVNQIGPYQFDKIDNPKDVYEYAWLAIYNAYRYGVGTSGVSKNYTTDVQNPNHTAAEAGQFASAHLFDYNNSETNFTRNNLENWMLYDVPGAIYSKTGTGATASSTMSGAFLVNPDGKLNPQARLLYSDSYDKYLLENKLRQEYNVSASGGSDKLDYFVSLGYLEDPSYIRGSKFSRYSGRTNINAQLYDWLKVGTNVAYSNRSTQSPATRYGRNPGSGNANPFRFINGQNPLIQLYAHDQNGNVIKNPDGGNKVHVLAGDTYSPLGLTGTAQYSTNILTMLDQDKDVRNSSDLTTRTYAEVKLLKDLKFTTNLSYEKYSEVRTRYWQSATGQAQGTGAFGKVYQNVTVLNSQELLDYGHDFGKHHVDGLFGHEFNKYTFDNLNFNSAYELIPGFISFANYVGHYTGGTFSTPGGSDQRTAMESYFARSHYIYDDKYYVEASVRRDGSSKFKTDATRWGTFWALGGGWRISKETFMESTKSWLNNLKLRADYGVIGNQNGIGMYSGYQTWGYGAIYTSTTAGNGIPASFTLSKGGYVNDGLSWENTKTFDVGFDFTLFDRVHGVIDYFNKNTDNAVWDQPIALSLGQGSLQKNSARIVNKGLEIQVDVDIIKNKDFYWNVSTNGTTYTTKLMAVPKGVGATGDGTWTATADAWSASGGGASSGITYLRGVGKDYYNLYVFKYAGVDQNTGLPLFYHKVTEADHTAGLYTAVTVGGDAKTTNYSTASRYELGSAIPKWIGGFSTTFKYKDFDFSAQLSYQLGGKFYSTDYGNSLYNSEYVGYALSAELIGNTWTPENKNAKFPMAMYKSSYTDGATFGSWLYTDMALFSASYMDVKNVTVGYTFPKKMLQKTKISALRLYISADNLYMLTSHSGIDPRQSLVGGFEVGAYTYPSMRTISFGVNLDL